MKKRIISAIIMMLLCIPLLILGGEYFTLFVAIIGVLGLKELLDLRRKEHDIPFLVVVLSYLSVIYIVFSGYLSTNLYLSIDFRLIAILIFIFLIPCVIVDKKYEYSFNDGLYLLGCIFLIGFSFNLIVLVRNHSLSVLIYLLLITIVTDTFALVTGKLIGKNKLCPTISPNKTVEGLIGGTIFSTFVASVFYITVINPSADIIRLLIVTVSLSLIGQLGDLVFSSIKRKNKVKDFSNLIPGHGGILDRLDSLIFVVLMYVMFIGVL